MVIIGIQVKVAVTDFLPMTSAKLTTKISNLPPGRRYRVLNAARTELYKASATKMKSAAEMEDFIEVKSEAEYYNTEYYQH